MFRTELEAKLKQIFGLKKVTFDVPGDSHEQDTLFVEVMENRTRITGNKATAKVQGALTVFAHGDRLPFGFFAKRIALADPELTKDFFFFDLDVNVLSSPARLQDLSEIRGRFVYLYSAQFDPNKGELQTLILGDING